MARARAEQTNTRKPSRAELDLCDLARRISNPMDPQSIKTQSNVFDLDSRDYVTVVKVGTFEPVADAKEAMARIGNDSAKFLEILNSGLKSHALEQLRESDAPWMTEDEEDNLTPFTGTTISEEKGKQLAANVLNMAKMLFSYSKSMDRDEKRSAKAKAQDMLLSQPAVLEALKGK